MKVIYRFPINMHRAAETGGELEIEMPLGSKILHVDTQERAPHEPCMWVLCDPDREPVARHFLVIGTGTVREAFPTDHIGTWQQHGFVWHLFETTP